ncbi:unnamed protein product, partial [Strongylus vulgaris]
STWEPEENVACHELIAEFERKRAKTEKKEPSTSTEKREEKQLHRIIGLTDSPGELHFLIKWKDHTADLVPAKEANVKSVSKKFDSDVFGFNPIYLLVIENENSTTIIVSQELSTSISTISTSGKSRASVDVLPTSPMILDRVGTGTIFILGISSSVYLAVVTSMLIYNEINRCRSTPQCHMGGAKRCSSHNSFQRFFFPLVVEEAYLVLGDNMLETGGIWVVQNAFKLKFGLKIFSTSQGKVSELRNVV